MSESRDQQTEWVDVYGTATGIKQTVPAWWLGHPVLGADIRKTPLTKAAETARAKADGPKEK